MTNHAEVSQDFLQKITQEYSVYGCIGDSFFTGTKLVPFGE